jgi:hypothetical protein
MNRKELPMSDGGWHGSGSPGGHGSGNDVAEINWHAIEQTNLEHPVILPLHDPGGPVQMDIGHEFTHFGEMSSFAELA